MIHPDLMPLCIVLVVIAIMAIGVLVDTLIQTSRRVKALERQNRALHDWLGITYRIVGNEHEGTMRYVVYAVNRRRQNDGTWVWAGPCLQF